MIQVGHAIPSRRAAVITLVLALGVCAPMSAVAALRGPFELVSLPSLGSVAWSCRQGPQPAWGLLVRIDPRFATTTVAFSAEGNRARRVVLQPGGRLRLPVLGARRQRLDFEQHTKPGLLRAQVVVSFTPGRGCYPYDPPNLTVRLFARR